MTSTPLPTVVLLHGLARRSGSMSKLGAVLSGAGFRVCNLHYPSTRHPIEVLAREHLLPVIRACRTNPAGGEDGPVHAVTHSMGGILLRELAARDPSIRFERVVMLGPPNHGSEIVDRLGQTSLFRWINGPAGTQLGTGSGSVPKRLGPAPFEVGIIAGDRPVFEPFRWLVSAPSDGKVSVASTRLFGMRDHIVLPVNHMGMMRDPMVIAQTLHFLREGRFQRAAEQSAA